MKHIISFLLAILSCFICILFDFPITNVSAQIEMKINKGEIVSLSVIIPETLSVKSGSIEFEYGSDFKCISGDWCLQNTTMKSYSEKTRKGIFTFSSDLQIAGNVFNIELEATDKIALGMHSISYTITFRDSEGVSTAFNDNYVINIVNQLKPAKNFLGDVNGDNVVSILDGSTIQRSLVGLPAPNYDTDVADTNDDGKITNQDVIEIQRYLVKLSSNNKIGKYLE